MTGFDAVVGRSRALADAFPVARETFEEVDDALGQKLGRLMSEGPESDLTLTENAQPAIMAASSQTADAQEGMASFLEKRPPKWVDR